MNETEDKWPRPADITDDCGDGIVRRVWYVGGQKDCTHVEIWMPEKALNMLFSATGCLHLRSYSNGSTPENVHDDSDVSYMHVCDVGEFVDALNHGASLAEGHWRKI